MIKYLMENRKYTYALLALMLTFILVVAYLFRQHILAENMWITVVLGLGGIYVTGNVAQRRIESRKEQLDEPISEQPS